MKRLPAVVVPVLFLLAFSADIFFNDAARAQAPNASAQTQNVPVTPNAAGSVAAQTGETVEARRRLQCRECHGQGRTLPYLAGSLFHAEEPRAYDSGFHAKAHQNGGGAGDRAATCLDCHTEDGRGDMSTMLPLSDPASPIARANLADTCGRCHGDPNVMRGSGITTRPFLSFRESVHAQAASRGNLGAAVCSDCHRAHDVLPATDARSPIFKFNVPATCGQCHPAVTDEFSASVHGQAAARGVSQTPVCTDCHGIHTITQPDAAGPTLRTNGCARCHEGVRLSEEFGVAGARVQSYENSYHGLARRLGSPVAADCASCHGVHNILPSSDPKSMIAQGNLTQTCGQCHPGAGENFTKGKVHLNAPASQDAGSTGVRLVRWFYLPVIFLTVGGMAVHNLLVWRKKAARKLRHERRTITRLTRNQRAQHWLLLTSFVVLVVSGFALVYPGAWYYYLGLEAEGTRRWVHRAAAVVMMCVGVYHLAYVLAAREGRLWLRDMVPQRKDAVDLWRNLLYYAGRRRTRPSMARFGYAEKAEYWAVIWGTLVMGLTGLMVWFKVGWFGWLPRWWIDVATAVHFYEAVLATLAIVVWHFYHVVFDPEVYPVNLAFYDGKVSEEFYREEHGLDFERLQESRGGGAGEGSEPDVKGGGAEPLPGAAGD
jgi:formate dehydrogenase gamma subunit